MNPRTYQAPTMAEALAKVKRDLGRDAVILRTRTVKRGGIIGLGARIFVEITAGRDADGVAPTRPRARAPQSPAAQLPAPGPAELFAAAARVPAPATAGVAPATVAPSSVAVPPELRRELQDIKALVENLMQHSGRERAGHLPVELRQAYIRLVQNQVEEGLAGQLVQRIESSRAQGRDLDPEFVRQQLLRYVSGILKKGCPIDAQGGSGRKVVALIGPTGVGKTTTVAKLAAHFALREKRRVGMATLDTYRIAAVDQLRTYARIIDVPLEVVQEAGEVQEALQRLGQCDVVLVDTAGRSQFDAARLAELKGLLEAVRPTETHLVLPASGSHAVLMKAVEHFGPLGLDRVIFTKIDEAVGIGTMLGVMKRVDARLSYVTTGQDVPDDIEVCDSQRLARLIVDGAAEPCGV